MDDPQLAPMKPQVYVDPRPAAYFDRFHERARTREPDWLYTFIRVVSYPLCRFVFRLHATGIDNVPPDGPVILAPNHFSAMDHRFVGILQRDEEAIITALTILERGGMLVIYPEGGRSRSGRIGDSARPGIGRLALESGAPVVPLAIDGSERARNWRRLRLPAVRLSYGQPMRFAREPGAPRERQHEVADEVLAAVRALHDDLVASSRRRT